MRTGARREGKKLENQGTNPRPWILAEEIVADVLIEGSVVKCWKWETKVRDWNFAWL
jgi:hypothetical protein